MWKVQIGLSRTSARPRWFVSSTLWKIREHVEYATNTGLMGRGGGGLSNTNVTVTGEPSVGNLWRTCSGLFVRVVMGDQP